jgi:hypothetical protein
MHQLLDGDGRMVRLARCDQNIEKLGRSILELINVDTSIQYESLAVDPIVADKRRAKVRCGSNRAQRTAASKSKLATLEAELQSGVDLAASVLERFRSF